MSRKNTILSLNSRVIPNSYSRFLEGTDWKPPYGIVNASLLLHMQPPTPGSDSENEKREQAFRIGCSWARFRKSVAGLEWQHLTILGPLQSSTICRATPKAEKWPASGFSWNCSFYKDVSDQKKQANHMEKMHDQLLTRNVETCSAQWKNVYKAHTRIHRKCTHTYAHHARLEGSRTGNCDCLYKAQLSLKLRH